MTLTRGLDSDAGPAKATAAPPPAPLAEAACARGCVGGAGTEASGGAPATMLPMLVRAGPSDGTDVRARKGEGAEAAVALLASAAVAARGAPVASSYKSVSKSAADMEVMKAVLPSRAPGGCCSVAAL